MKEFVTKQAYSSKRMHSRLRHFRLLRSGDDDLRSMTPNLLSAGLRRGNGSPTCCSEKYRQRLDWESPFGTPGLMLNPPISQQSPDFKNSDLSKILGATLPRQTSPAFCTQALVMKTPLSQTITAAEVSQTAAQYLAPVSCATSLMSGCLK